MKKFSLVFVSMVVFVAFGSDSFAQTNVQVQKIRQTLKKSMGEALSRRDSSLKKIQEIKKLKPSADRQAQLQSAEADLFEAEGVIESAEEDLDALNNGPLPPKSKKGSKSTSRNSKKVQSVK